MNVLLDKEAAEKMEDNFKSTTQDIIEYTFNVPDEETGVNQKLIVIDTPGFKDTNDADGEAKDSRIMATLEQYIANHADLKGCYPNAVIFVARFDDKSLQKEESFLIQFLTELEKLIENYVLVDTGPTTCNLILVLTHFMRASLIERENPEPRVRSFLALLKTFTKIPSNICVVLAENKGQVHNLDVSNGYTVLPNGEKYPYSLFRAIQKTAILAGDKVGQRIISNAFYNPLTVTKAGFTHTPLLEADHQDSRRHYFNIHNKILYTPFEENPVTLELEREWDVQPVQERGTSNLPLKIAKSIFIREGLDSKSKFPKSTSEILKLYRQLPVNEGLAKVIKKIGIHPPFLSTYTVASGYFYNISIDTISQATPFKLVAAKITESGFAALPYLDVNLVHNIHCKIWMQLLIHNSIEDYSFSRLRALGVQVKENKLSVMSPVSGHNIADEKTGKHFAEKLTRISGIKEYRLYSATLNTNFIIDNKYLDSIRKIPPYTSREHVNWVEHFSKFGTHIVRHCYLGGSIIIIGERKRDVREEFDNYIEAANFITYILTNLGEVVSFSNFRIPKGWTFEVICHGGDPNITMPGIETILEHSGVDVIMKWRDSLVINPKLLFSEIKLEHISACLTKEYFELSNKVSKAANCVFGIKEFEDLDVVRPRAKKDRCYVM